MAIHNKRLLTKHIFHLIKLESYVWQSRSLEYLNKIENQNKSDNFKMPIWSLQIFQKTNKNASHSSKNEFICSFFGRIHDLTIFF